MAISPGTVFVFIVFCCDVISARNDTLCHRTSTLDRAKRCVGFEGFPRLRLEQSPKFEPKFVPAKPWPKDHKHPAPTYKYIQESRGGGQPLILKPMPPSNQQSPPNRPTYKYVQEADGAGQPLILKPMSPSNQLSPSDHQGEHSNSKHRNDLRPGNRLHPKYRSNVLTANNSSSIYRPISSRENNTTFNHQPNRHHVLPNITNRPISSNGLIFEHRANKPFREHSTSNHRSNLPSLNAPNLKYRPNLSPRDVASSTDRKNLRPGNQPRRSRQRNTSPGNDPNGASSNTHPQFPPNTGMEEKEQGKIIQRPYKSATSVIPPSGCNEVSLQKIRNSPDFKNLHYSPARKGKYEYRIKCANKPLRPQLNYFMDGPTHEKPCPAGQRWARGRCRIVYLELPPIKQRGHAPSAVPVATQGVDTALNLAGRRIYDVPPFKCPEGQSWENGRCRTPV